MFYIFIKNCFFKLSPYGKNNFAKTSKNSARYKSDNNFVHQDNYIGHSNCLLKFFATSSSTFKHSV